MFRAGLGRGRGRGRIIDDGLFDEDQMVPCYAPEGPVPVKFPIPFQQTVEGELREFRLEPVREDDRLKDMLSKVEDESEKTDEEEVRQEAQQEEKEGSVSSSHPKSFWMDHRKLDVPAIPDQAAEVMDEVDMEIHANEEWLGKYYKPDEKMHNDQRDLKPMLPDKIELIVDDGESRWFLLKGGTVKLPINLELDTRLCCIDVEDVLHIRFQEEEQDLRDGRIHTYKKLVACLRDYYIKPQNQLKSRQTLWIPRLGEVVIVRLGKILPCENVACGYVDRMEFQRAVVKGVSQSGVLVSLIDDYGIGEVPFKDIFKIEARYTVLSPQLFSCELAEMGLINFRKLIHNIVRDCPIPNIWPDYNLNYVGTTWRGQYSGSGRPLVEINIQTRCCPFIKFVSLKAWIFQNIGSALKPFVHLLDGPTPGCIVDADECGFMWVNFDKDKESRRRMKAVLKELLPCYKLLIEDCHLTVDNIISDAKDHEACCRHRADLEKLYAVVLPDVGGKTGDQIYRVVVKEAYRENNMVKVNCIDNNVDETVSASELVPLGALYPDIAHIPPLIHKVHLYGIRELKIKDSRVANALHGERVVVQLVREWPNPKFPPDVLISVGDDVTSGNETDEEVAMKEMQRKEKPLKGLSRRFVKRGLAEEITNEETDYLIKFMQKELDSKRSSDQRLYRKESKSTEWLKSSVFMGEQYRFQTDLRVLPRMVGDEGLELLENDFV